MATVTKSLHQTCRTAKPESTLFQRHHKPPARSQSLRAPQPKIQRRIDFAGRFTMITEDVGKTFDAAR